MPGVPSLLLRLEWDLSFPLHRAAVLFGAGRRGGSAPEAGRRGQTLALCVKPRWHVAPEL